MSQRANLRTLLGSCFVIATAVMVSACRPSSAPVPTTVVFAAASLTESFRALARAYESLHPDAVIELHFAGTPTLVLQIKEGAAADLLAAADEDHMQVLEQSGWLKAPAEIFATNRLVIVTPKGNPRQLQSLADLTAPDLVLILAAEAVPVGHYARQAFRKAGLEPRSRSDESSVHGVMTRVALGEADAGIAYWTDALAAEDRVTAVQIPAEFNVKARYPLAILQSTKAESSAQSFCDFVQSEAGQEILLGYGFSRP